ncbi:MAG: chorismate mutase [Antricoccus sp.]
MTNFDKTQADGPRIAVLRGQIDAVDDTIIRLIVERSEMSRRIAAMRSATGGTGVDLGGEYKTITKFHQALGKNGSALASLLLRSRRSAC